MELSWADPTAEYSAAQWADLMELYLVAEMAAETADLSDWTTVGSSVGEWVADLASTMADR